MLLLGCSSGDDVGANQTVPRAAAGSSTPPLAMSETPRLAAFSEPCDPCLSAAAETYGELVVENNCVMLDVVMGQADATGSDRSTQMVLFPRGTEWSAADGGIVFANGVVAVPGTLLHAGGGSTRLSSLDSAALLNDPEWGLTRLDDATREVVRDCTRLSDEPTEFWETSPLMVIEVVNTLPDY